jgi:hypothetical protein
LPVAADQVCQMAYFQTKNPDLGKFWRVLQWKMLVFYMAIWVYFIAIWYFCGHYVYLWLFGVFFRYGMVYQAKSGNPAADAKLTKNEKMSPGRKEAEFLPFDKLLFAARKQLTETVSGRSDQCARFGKVSTFGKKLGKCF